jgi:hypothetical protein
VPTPPVTERVAAEPGQMDGERAVRIGFSVSRLTVVQAVPVQPKLYAFTQYCMGSCNSDGVSDAVVADILLSVYVGGPLRDVPVNVYCRPPLADKVRD